MSTDAEFAESLIIRPTVEASVERASERLTLRWAPRAGSVAIYAGDDPARIDRTRPHALLSAAAGETTLDDPFPRGRAFFELVFDGGPDAGLRVVVAERVLPLDGGVNVRDLGGYATADGRRTRWGRLYRSGSLAGLSDEDVDYLAVLGLRLACDLRSAHELEHRPDRLPAGAALLPLEVIARVNPMRRMLALYRHRHNLQALLQEVYTVMIDQNGPVVRALFGRAADPDSLPLVFHCTAGKDRTGIAAALLLAALGVPDETIVADYTLSNAAYDALAESMRPELEPLYRLGLNDSQLRPILLAEPKTLRWALAHIRRRYGSVEGYLGRVAGVGPELIEQLQAGLLTGD